MYFSTIKRLSFGSLPSAGFSSVLVPGILRCYNKVPGLVLQRRMQTGKNAERPCVGGREVLLTNDVQDGKDQAWWPRRDLLTSARSLKEVWVWPWGCLKGECSRNSKEAIVSAAQWEQGREQQWGPRTWGLRNATTCRAPWDIVKTLCETGSTNQCSAVWCYLIYLLEGTFWPFPWP